MRHVNQHSWEKHQLLWPSFPPNFVTHFCWKGVVLLHPLVQNQGFKYILGLMQALWSFWRIPFMKLSCAWCHSSVMLRGLIDMILWTSLLGLMLGGGDIYYLMSYSVFWTHAREFLCHFSIRSSCIFEQQPVYFYHKNHLTDHAFHFILMGRELRGVFGSTRECSFHIWHFVILFSLGLILPLFSVFLYTLFWLSASTKCFFLRIKLGSKWIFTLVIISDTKFFNL